MYIILSLIITSTLQLNSQEVSPSATFWTNKPWSQTGVLSFSPVVITHWVRHSRFSAFEWFWRPRPATKQSVKCRLIMERARYTLQTVQAIKCRLVMERARYVLQTVQAIKCRLIMERARRTLQTVQAMRTASRYFHWNSTASSSASSSSPICFV